MPSRSSTTSGKPGKPAAKSTAGKRVAVKTPATPSVPAKPRSRVKKAGLMPPEDRMRFIAEAAYYKAEQRGFAAGGELGDWIAAEAEIDALLDSRSAG